MKVDTLSLLALAASANAQIRRGERHRHLHQRDVVYDTQVEYVTASAPAAVVYVDQNGNPVSTAYNGGAPPAAATPAPAAAPYSAPQPEPYSAPAPAPYSPPASSSAAAQAPPPAQSSQAPTSNGGGSSSSGSGSGLGITYSPYNADNSCKSQEQVTSDFAKIDGYSLVRLYGVDCNQVTTVLNAAKPKGIKLFVGIFDITQASTEAQTLISAVNGDWSSIDTVSVGNEIVNAGGSPSAVIAALNAVRGQLKSAGYNGNVVTVDTFVALIAHPELCQASDYAAANCHAFFDGGKTAQEAGQFVADQAQRVKDACGGKRTVITESGWPWQGDSNGAAVPGTSQQNDAISSLKSNFSKDLFLFSAYDTLWKKDFSGSFGCEKWWGVVAHDS